MRGPGLRLHVTVLAAAATLAATGCESDTSTSLGGGEVGIVPSGATLSALSISAAPLNPSFSAATTSYTAAVINAITNTTVTAGAASGFTITVNGVAVASGVESSPIPLGVGNNTILVVTSNASGSATRTYTIVVTRAAF